MSTTVWYFLRPGPGELQPLARKAFDAFTSGEVSLPSDEDGYVRYVELVVRLENRQATKLISVRFFRMRTLADGHVDPEHAFEIMAAAGGVMSGAVASVEPLPGVVNAEHRFAERRLRNLSRWEPAKADTSALHELVNRRAKATLC